MSNEVANIIQTVFLGIIMLKVLTISSPLTKANIDSFWTLLEQIRTNTFKSGK